jgi:hypothetical protein
VFAAAGSRLPVCVVVSSSSKLAPSSTTTQTQTQSQLSLSLPNLHPFPHSFLLLNITIPFTTPTSLDHRRPRVNMRFTTLTTAFLAGAVAITHAQSQGNSAGMSNEESSLSLRR